MIKAFGQFDAGGNGVIVRDDIMAIGNQLLSAFREDMASVKAAALFDGIIIFWNALAEAALEEADALLTGDQFCEAMTELLIDDQEAFDTVLAPMWKAILMLADFDADGWIGREEFAAILIILGTPVDEIATAFDTLDQHKVQRLSLDEVLDAVQDFYACSDAHAIGNHMFGLLTPLD